MSDILLPEGVTILNPDKVFIGGSWMKPATDKTITLINPNTEQPVGRVAEAVEADMDRAVEAARKAFDFSLEISKIEFGENNLELPFIIPGIYMIHRGICLGKFSGIFGTGIFAMFSEGFMVSADNGQYMTMSTGDEILNSELWVKVGILCQIPDP